MSNRLLWLKFGLIALILIALCSAVSAQSAPVTQIPVTPPIFHFAVLPDSSLIAVAEDGALNDDAVSPADLPIQLIDLRTGQPSGQLAGATDYANGLSFSPDGQTLASCHNNGVVNLWDVASKSLKSTFVFSTPTHGCVIRFLPDGQHVAINRAGFVPAVGIWDVSSGAMTKLLVEPFDTYAQFSLLTTSTSVPDDGVMAFDISPDGQSLVAATAMENVWLWKLSDGSGQQIIASGDALPNLSIRQISFSADGSQIAYFDNNAKELHVWNVASASESTPVSLDAWTAAVSPDGKTIASASSKGDSVSFQPASGSAVSVSLPGGVPMNSSLIFAPDGKTVILSGTATSGSPRTGVIDVVPVP